jgi:hypothetical protein
MKPLKIESMKNEEESGTQTSGTLSHQSSTGLTTMQQIEKMLADNKPGFSIGKVYNVLKIEKPTEVDLKTLNDAELGYVFAVISLEESKSNLPGETM